MLLLWTAPLLGQLQIDGVQMNADGTLAVGYSGNYGDLGGSGHGMTFAADSQINGFYYNPNFLSFSVLPFYNRSQTTSGFGSISNSSGVSASAEIFGGSHFPGSIYYNKTVNDTSVYGIPNTAGLVSNGSNRAIGFDWTFRFARVPEFSVSFDDSNGDATVPGLDTSSHSNQKIWFIRSSYKLKGFRITGDFRHLNNNAELHQVINGSASTSRYANASNQISLYTGHRIPMRGSVNINFNHYTFNATQQAKSHDITGSSNNFGLSANIFPAKKLTVTGTTQMSDDVRGGFEQYIIEKTGQPVPLTEDVRSSGRSFSVAATYRPTTSLGLGGGIAHATASSNFGSVSVTQYSGVVTYTFAKVLRGLYVNGGMIDTANKTGNNGLTGYLTVSYSRYVKHWKINPSFGYSQDVHTLGIVYTTSGYSYGISADRVFSHRKIIGFGFSGGHTGITQEDGLLNHNENFYAHLTYHRVDLHGNFSRSYGQAIQTATGLVGVPSQLPPGSIPSEFLRTYHGESEGFGMSIALIGNLSLGGGISKGRYTSFGLNQDSTLGNQLSKTFAATAHIRYNLRKLVIVGGYSRLDQETVPAIRPGGVSTAFFVGVSRWFHLF